MLRALWKKKRSKPDAAAPRDRGILVFENTTAVIQAESILKAGGWKVKVMGPPPEIRSGCDLVIEFPLVEELSIIRKLSENGIKPFKVVPIHDVLLEPVDLLHEREYGSYLMVRAANMKITVDRETGLIVNLSGGGCPDVPYLADQMVGKHLENAPLPRDIGYTLCAYALQIAYERMVERCSV